MATPAHRMTEDQRQAILTILMTLAPEQSTQIKLSAAYNEAKASSDKDADKLVAFTLADVIGEGSFGF